MASVTMVSENQHQIHTVIVSDRLHWDGKVEQADLAKGHLSNIRPHHMGNNSIAS